MVALSDIIVDSRHVIPPRDTIMMPALGSPCFIHDECLTERPKYQFCKNRSICHIKEKTEM